VGFQDAVMPLGYSRALVHLTTDAQPLIVARRETLTAAAITVAVLWIFALCAGIFLVGRWRATAAAAVSRAEQTRLEGEIAVAKRVEAELRKAAFTDALTGLPNRGAFLQAGARVLAATRSGMHAVFLVDLDRFNITNETLGHPAGDELLRILAARLKARVGPEGFIGRLGGDEFVLLLPCTADRVYRMGEQLLRSIAEPAVLYGRTIYPQASIGIAIVERSYRFAEDLLRDADIAMYAAKNRGRARCALFDKEMRRQVALDAELELDLRRAIEHGAIVPYYQPIVELATGDVASFEALARWKRGSDTLTGSEFVPFSEARGFVYQIDATIQRATLSQAESILALFPSANIALNVSAPELTSPLFAEQLRGLLEEYAVNPETVRLEITETTMMTRADEAHKTLKALTELGISVVLDDFGTGYSSLAYLQRLPISGVKIDRSFVADIDTDERSHEIVRSIVALAHVLGLSTTAEGVEREAQIDALREVGVTYGQGFFFSPPVAVGRLADLATQRGNGTYSPRTIMG
jgi:diguanylate cyclase (GGDEF)-like protein